MIIPDSLEKHKISLKTLVSQAFLPIIAVLLISGTIGAWKVYQIYKNREQITIEYPKKTQEPQNNAELGMKYVTSTSTMSSIDKGLFVASRGGKSYYKPTCAGAKKLSEKNKIWFQSKEEAERFGYKLAKNCK
ncbi:MAG: hypothetical protein V4519_02565 [Patescibacteria group bacterium]